MLSAEIKDEQQTDGEFTVEATEFGHLVFTKTGRLNIDALTRIGSLTAEQDAVILPGVARACNAFMAICPRDKAMGWLADVERQAKDQSGGDRELEWLLGPHVGDSSETIFSVLSDKHCHRLSDPARVVKFRPATPSDPDDFSRCYRLLQMVPEWAGRIAEVGETYAAWKPFAGNWGELTEIYEAEVAASEADGRAVPVCPKLWERLKGLSEMSAPLWGVRSQIALTPGASDTKSDSEGDASASANRKPDLRALYPVPDAACSRGQFLADVVKHEMTVLLDHPDGYRHIRFKRPDSGQYWFQLTTWPGYLAITGDMGDFTFTRCNDMFAFFRPDDGEKQNLSINPGYWGEKCVARGRNGLDSYNPATFKAHIADWCADDENLTPEQWQEIVSEVISQADEGPHVAVCAALEFQLEVEPDRGPGQRARYTDYFQDFWERDCTEWNYEYLWCLYAIVWGIRVYDQWKAASTATGAPALATES